MLTLTLAVRVAALFIPTAAALDADGFTIGATTGDPEEFTRLGYPESGERGDWDVGFVFDYADNPLTEVGPAGRVPVVDALATGDFGLAYSFGGLRLDAALPLHAGADTGGSFAATGDARLGAQLSVPGVKGLALHTMAYFPTGSELHYVGGAPRLLAEAIGAREFGRVGVGIVAGALLSLPEEDRGLKSGAGPVFGAGVAYRVSKALSAMVELSGEGEWGLQSVPVEATLSARMRLPAGIWATAGAAAGIGNGVGASRWRAFAGLGFSMRAAESEQDSERPVMDLAADPTGDRDADGFFDVDDACPDQAETIDGFEDGDGCPELDGDGDGVTFEKDGCPREPILPEQDPRYSDGCPRIAEMAGDHIAITETIFFREGHNELVDSADPVLMAIRDEMMAHPEIALFLIEGHTNSNGSPAYNARLSDARAFTVMRWLVGHGVEPMRLLSKGFGESRPLVGAEAEDALAINRRVEIKVVHVEDIPADARRIALPADVK
jgi:outer membrane protein OmpA-like peptidoglycan-associated protein